MEKYKKYHDIFLEDVKNNKLTYEDVRKRYDKLFKLIPFDVDIDFFYLDSLIREKYPDEHKKNCRTFTINVGNISSNDAEKYIKKVANKIKMPL